MIKDKTVEFNDEVNILQVEEANLLLDTAAYNTIHDVYENNLSRFKKLVYEYHVITKQRENEKEEKEKKFFETRLKLNNTQRKMIETFEENYKSVGKQKLEEEAEQARIKRTQLSLEFDSRAKQVESLIRTQQSNYDKYSRLVVERDITVKEIEKQQEKAAQLYEENKVNKLKIKEFTEEIDKNKSQNAILMKEVQTKRELFDQSKEMENKLIDLRKHRKKLTQATVLSSQNLLDKSWNIAGRSANKVVELLKSIGGQYEDAEFLGLGQLENTSDNCVLYNIHTNSIYKNENVNDKKDTELVWNSRREENYQIMSDSIRKFLRKKKRIL